MPGGFQHAPGAARVHLNQLRAAEKPAHQIDVIGQCINHRRGMRITREHRQRLRTGVEHACRRAGDFADPALDDLLFGNQVALFVSAAVAHAHIRLAARALGSRDDAVGLHRGQRNRFFHQHRLACGNRRQHRFGVLPLGGGNHHRRYVGVVDNFQIVAGINRRADFVRQRLGVGRVSIRRGDESHCRMLRCQARTQRTDATGADDG